MMSDIDGDIHTIKLPIMGDSITEGQIAEWTKSVSPTWHIEKLHRCVFEQLKSSRLLVADVGDYVQVDDLVVLVDTDKVSWSSRYAWACMCFYTVHSAWFSGCSRYQFSSPRESCSHPC